MSAQDFSHRKREELLRIFMNFFYTRATHQRKVTHHSLMKSGCWGLLALLLVIPLKLQSSDNKTSHEECILHAEESVDSGDYLQASAFYQEALDQLRFHSQKTSMEATIRCNLATVLILSEQYLEAIKTLQAVDACVAKKYFLMGKAYQKDGQFKNALSAFRRYLEISKDQEAQDEVNWEIGFAYFQLANYEQANIYFNLLTPQTEFKEFYLLSQLYLARIDISLDNLVKAEKRLSDLASLISLPNPLRYEWAYLFGELCLRQKNEARALDFFEQAIPLHKQHDAVWYPEVLKQVGKCCLKLAEEKTEEMSRQKLLLDKAEQALLTLRNLLDEDEAYLLLGRCYLIKGQCFSDQKEFQKVNDLFSQRKWQSLPDSYAESLLIRAHAASSYDLKDSLYQRLIQETPSENRWYIQGWYEKGVNDLQEGERLKSQKSPASVKPLEQAIIAFKTTFQLSQKTQPQLAAKAAKREIQACLMVGTSDSCQQAFSLLQSLQQNDWDISSSFDDQGEVLYLLGLTASALAKNDHENYTHLSERFWQQAGNLGSKSKWSAAAQFALATLYFQQGQYADAEKIFLDIAEQQTSSSYAGDALFFASRCFEIQQKDADLIREYRRKVFEEYPESLYAAEAYLTYYPFIDYMQGDPSPLEHLKAMPHLFPSSPFTLHAYYLIGMDWKKERKAMEGKLHRKRSLLKAIEAFHEAESLFDTLNAKGLIPENNLDYFTSIRYRSCIERAMANLGIAAESKGAKRNIYLEYAADVFKQIIHDFETPNHPLTQAMIHGEPYPSLCEESEYGLMQTYLKAQDDRHAEKVLAHMFEKYNQAHITRGYFLSRAWYDQGLIRMRRQDFHGALDALKQAEDCAKGKVLSADQKLDLWIQQSHCYRAMQQLEVAMRILSQVINEDAISGLRLKAMYLRAEIYEEQGRDELALKQLEALAKKGGEWSLKAKEKLEKEYRY